MVCIEGASFLSVRTTLVWCSSGFKGTSTTNGSCPSDVEVCMCTRWVYINYNSSQVRVGLSSLTSVRAWGWLALLALSMRRWEARLHTLRRVVKLQLSCIDRVVENWKNYRVRARRVRA